MVEPNEKESSQFFQFFGNQIALMNDVLFKYQKDEHPVIDTLKNNLNIFDEYPVENFHSLLRRQTTAKVSTAKSLRRDALFIDHFHHENSLGAAFSPKQNYPYSKKDLDFLVKKTALFLLDFFDEVWKNNGLVEERMEGKRIKKPYYYFQNLKSGFPIGALPLGFHTPVPPSQENFCDRIECTNRSIESSHVLVCAIDELTSSYNQRLHMEEDINNELFSENNIQNTNPDFEDADHIISLPGIDNQLQKRILDDDLDLLMFTDNLAGQNNVMLYLQNEENVVEDTNDLKKIRTTTNEVEDLQIIGFTFRNQDLFIQLNEEKQCAKST
ncbi:1_t:CDS:2, partial [Entrophospora sp. SA101]